MNYTFDGTNKLIVLGAGPTTLAVQDMYSRWKEWAATGDNLKYPSAFNVIGGDPTVGDNKIAPYFFLQNGWKVRSQEASHTLTVDGILLDAAGGDPFQDTIGNWRVRIVQVVPLQAETITVYSSGAGPTLTKQDVRDAMALPATEAPQPGSLDRAVGDVGDLVVALS